MPFLTPAKVAAVLCETAYNDAEKSFSRQVSDFYEFFGKKVEVGFQLILGRSAMPKSNFWHNRYHGRGRISKPGRLERIAQRPGVVRQAERGNDIYDGFQL